MVSYNVPHLEPRENNCRFQFWCMRTATKITNDAQPRCARISFTLIRLTSAGLLRRITIKLTLTIVTGRSRRQTVFSRDSEGRHRRRHRRIPLLLLLMAVAPCRRQHPRACNQRRFPMSPPMQPRRPKPELSSFNSSDCDDSLDFFSDGRRRAAVPGESGPTEGCFSFYLIAYFLHQALHGQA